MNENSKLYEDTNDQITLTLEDGTDLICDVLAIFPVDGKDYIALLPQGDDPDAEFSCIVSKRRARTIST